MCCCIPRFIDNLMCVSPICLQRRAIELASRFEGGRKTSDWITQLPAREIVFSLYPDVFVFAVTDVSAPPIRNELEEPRTFTGAN